MASFYAIATALWSIYCYALVVQTYQYQKSSYGTTWGPSYAVNAAGAVAVSTANFFYILARGLDDDTGDNANDEKKEMKNPTAASQV